MSGFTFVRRLAAYLTSLILAGALLIVWFRGFVPALINAHDDLMTALGFLAALLGLNVGIFAVFGLTRWGFRVFGEPKA